ncbi:hypothetical protein DYB28_011823 [Aphanomyces astaci]|uniref:Uncharacterized protein n=1 Tax=Aphanomyces astaci TaxID=112090 RepID=A0A3L6V2G0_APHAT|nr:hypothetical protein DYB34_005165 [Aphanomyces astaci]RHZ15442.1 hypothetical protein DYB26_007011 [Aphanomyces astaci]RLO02937.1 hypothetical protein DYB28_011823 [Aphanomyces astaci]
MKAVKQVGQLVASQGDDATMDNDGEIPIQLNLPGVTLNFTSEWIMGTLAISSLDEEKSKAEYIKEKLKVESLKHDMKALLEKAAHHNIDIKQFATHLKSM